MHGSSLARTAVSISIQAAKPWPRSSYGAPAPVTPPYLQRGLEAYDGRCRGDGATYWLASPDDSDKQWVGGKAISCGTAGMKSRNGPSGAISQQRWSVRILVSSLRRPDVFRLSPRRATTMSLRALNASVAMVEASIGWTRNPARNLALPWICLAGDSCSCSFSILPAASRELVRAIRRRCGLFQLGQGPCGKGAAMSFRVFREIRPKQNIRSFTRGCFPRSGNGALLFPF